MWISGFRTLAAAAASFSEMRLGYSDLALVASGLLSESAQCPGYTSYSQVNLLFGH